MKTYYHISNIDLGKHAILKAKLPNMAYEDIEGSLPRVCFSSSIYGCLLSLAGHPLACITVGILSALKTNRVINSKISNPVIYTTTEELIKPPNISDYQKTKEYHSYKDIQVTKLGYISISNCFKTYLRKNNLLVKITNRKQSNVTSKEFSLLKNIASNSLFKLNQLIKLEE